MWELDHKEGWAPKNWCFWTVLLEKTLESPLDCKEIKAVNPKGNQPWIFIGRTDVEAEAPILWPLNAKSRLIGIDPDTGKDWGQEEKQVRWGWDVGWYHWLKGHEVEQSLGDSEGHGSLACCSSQGHKELYVTYWLNSNNICLTEVRNLCQVLLSFVRQVKEPLGFLQGAESMGLCPSLLPFKEAENATCWNALIYFIFRSAHTESIFSQSTFILGNVLPCNREMQSLSIISSAPFWLWLFLCFP